MFYWTSLIEVVFFFFNIIFFVMNGAKGFWYSVMFLLFHMTRSLIGYYISRLLPPSHEITKRITYTGDQQLKFAQVKPELGSMVQLLILEYMDDFELPALVYTGASAICFLFDLISFFVFVGISANYKKQAQDILNLSPADQLPSSYGVMQSQSMISIFQLYLVMLYVIIDCSYLYWVAHWYFKLPKPLNVNVPMALLGLGARLREGFGFSISSGKKKG